MKMRPLLPASTEGPLLCTATEGALDWMAAGAPAQAKGDAARRFSQPACGPASARPSSRANWQWRRRRASAPAPWRRRGLRPHAPPSRAHPPMPPACIARLPAPGAVCGQAYSEPPCGGRPLCKAVPGARGAIRGTPGCWGPGTGPGDAAQAPTALGCPPSRTLSPLAGSRGPSAWEVGRGLPGTVRHPASVVWQCAEWPQQAQQQPGLPPPQPVSGLPAPAAARTSRLAPN